MEPAVLREGGVTSWLRVVIAVLLVGLTIAAVATTPGGQHRVACAAVVGTAMLGCFWAAGRDRRPTLWLAGATLCWLGLGVLSPLAAFVAFPLFFLELLVLPVFSGILAVLLTWLGVVWLLSTRTGGLSFGSALGPAIGAAVAIATVHSFQALHRESERRRSLLEELERTREELLATERRAGRLEERERLAAEIHDTLAQGFTSISLLLGTAHRLFDIEPGQARALVAEARRTAGENLQEARALVAANAPTGLERTSLEESLERLCGVTGQRAGLRIVLEAHPGADDPLDEQERAALLRVAQSALANVVTHSGASAARLGLGAHETGVLLEVCDDGHGFDPARVTPHEGGGYGLALMRRRLEHLGGWLQVDSTLGEGTRLGAWLPGRAPGVNRSDDNGRARQGSSEA